MATIAEALALAQQYQAGGHLSEAEHIYRQVLQANPNREADADIHFSLGSVLAQGGRLREGVEEFRKAVKLRPSFYEAHHNLANALRELGHINDALSHYQQAVALRPDFAEAYNNYAIALVYGERFEEATALFRKTIELNPRYAKAHSNLGNVLKEQGKFDEAVASYRRAIQLQPDYAEAHTNLGTALSTLGRHQEALDSLNEAIRLKPQFADPHSQRSLTWLRLGDFERGWAEYEWRWHCRDMIKAQRNFQHPLWDGGTHVGNRAIGSILLHAEQGQGDTMQFIRYAPLVRQRIPHVIVESPAGLAPLLATCPGIDRVVVQGSPLPHFDAHAPLMSLPRILCTTLATIPAEVPYLFADTEVVEYWEREVDKVTRRQGDKVTRRQSGKVTSQSALGAGLPTPPQSALNLMLQGGVRRPAPSGEDKETGHSQGIGSLPHHLTTPPLHHSPLTTHHSPPLKVGIAWRGSPVNVVNRYRSISLGHFERLARVDGVRLFSLQKGHGTEQLAELGGRFPVIDLGSRFGTWMDSAAALMNLDLVISIDTGIVHCAGALGVPVWVMLQYGPDWRWLLDREDSPWYPSMRLFRQMRWGDWDDVFDRVTAALVQFRDDPARPRPPRETRRQGDKETRKRGVVEEMPVAAPATPRVPVSDYASGMDAFFSSYEAIAEEGGFGEGERSQVGDDLAALVAAGLAHFPSHYQ